MTLYVLRRLAFAPVVLFSIAVFVFLLIRFVPGDIVDTLFAEQGTSASPEQAETLRRIFGLDLPVHEQFLAWGGAVIQGDLGTSLLNGRSIAGDLLSRFTVTVELALLALGLALVIGVPMGVLAATHRGQWVDVVATGTSLVGIAIPSFALATLLVLVVAVGFRLLPSTGFVPFFEDPVANLRHLALPVLALGLAEAAIVARTTRSALLSTLVEDHVRTARAKGLPGRAVLSRHVLGTSLVPILTVTGLVAGFLLSGTVIIEEIFSIPGLGRYALGGIRSRDYPVVQGAVLFIALIYFVVNLIVDVMVAWADPRVRERR